MAPLRWKRIRAIRAAVEMKYWLRIDANQGWKVNEAIETLNRTQLFGIQYCGRTHCKMEILKLKK